MISSSPLILKNAKVFIDNQLVDTDILIHKGKIKKIAKDIQVAEANEKDLTGLTILPGVIDSQVHFREPGLTHKEDIGSGSLAAILGGVTTFLEMPNTNPATINRETIEEKVKIAKDSSFSNYGFFIGATMDNLDDLKNADKIEGCCGIKIFLGSSTGSLLLNDKKTLEKIFKETTLPIAVHSEDEELLVQNKKVFENATSAIDHPKWRNVETALSSTKKIIEIAKSANKKVHILHLTTEEEVNFLRDNKDFCTIEVTPQHLTLYSPDCYQRLESFAQMNPPIREIRHQEALWKAVQDGIIDVCGSDHAPHTKEEKEKGYPFSPSGMPGVQTIVPIMLTHYNEGKITLEKLVDMLSTFPAKLYNLKSKGQIKENMDADLTIVDLKKDYAIKNTDMKSKCGWTPFHNFHAKGQVTHTIVSGNIIMEHNEVISKIKGLPI